MEQHLIRPHGGTLVDIMIDENRHDEIRTQSRDWASWDLTPRQTLELELLLNGAYSPLRGYMTQTEYDRVMREMRLPDGIFWPMPFVLDITEKAAEAIEAGSTVTLRDQEGVMLAVLHVEDKWVADRDAELTALFGTTDPADRAVLAYSSKTNPVYIGGRVEGVQYPIHYDFPDLRTTPRDVRSRIGRRGWRRMLSFDSHYPIHRPDVEATRHATKEADANLFIQPMVGELVREDIDHYTRIRTYGEVMKHYSHQTTILGLLPMPFKMAGLREIMMQAIVRKNYGASHFMFRATNSADKKGAYLTPKFSEVEAAFAEHSEDLGIQFVPHDEFVYRTDSDQYVAKSSLEKKNGTKTLTEADVRSRLQDGREIPAWFSYAEVVDELRKTYPPRSKQGFTVFFSGLSGSGKSTVANALLPKLLQIGGRPVTLLDGDIVRKNLSSELGFTKEHRDINILRIGYVASEITKNGGIAVCAPIAPYESTRSANRELIEPLGGYILVYVNTPIEECEKRDRKGLYAKARAGIIKEFTGISDPYDVPENAEIVIDTMELSPEEAVHKVLLYLANQGYIGEDKIAV
jgi:sulfate adenylyltransferase